MNNEETLDLQTQEQISDVVNESPAMPQEAPMVTSGQYDAVREYGKRVEADYAAKPVVKAGTEGYLGTNEYNTEVSPLKVNIYGEEFSINSVDPRKAAHDIMTKYKGYPEDYYLGYSYIPDGLSDGLVSNLLHGVAEAVSQVPTILAGTGEVITDVLVSPARLAARTGVLPIASAITAYVDRVNNNNYRVAQDASSWLYNTLNLEPFDTSFGGKLTRAIGQGATSLGVIIASGNPTIASAVMNAASYSNIKHSLMNKGISPLDAIGMATGGYAAITALDVVSNTALFNATKGLTPKVAGNIMKEMAAAKRSKMAAVGRGIGIGTLDMAQEGSTEVLQDKIEQVMSGDLGFDDYRNFFTSDDAITFLSGFLIGAVSLPGNIISEVKARDLSILENYKTNAQVADLLGRMQDAKKFLKDNMGFTEDESIDFLNRMVKNGTDAVLEELNNATREQVAKAKFDPEKVKSFYEAYKKLVESGKEAYVSEEEWKRLDESVERAMSGLTDSFKEGFDGSDLLLAKALFRGMAANVLYRTGMSISEFTERYVDGFGFGTETRAGKGGGITKDASTLYVRPDLGRSAGTSTAENALSPKYVPKADKSGFAEALDSNLSERHSTLIHEMMHKFHTIINDSFGTEEATRILDSMLAAVETVFGKKNAEAVKIATDGKFGWGKTKPYAGKQNTTEWIAQAAGVLGERMLEAFGVRGEAAEYLSFLHIMLGTANQYAVLPEALQNYIVAVENISKENGERLVAMAKDYGVDKLSIAAQSVIDSESADINWQGITESTIKELYDVSKLYVDGKGAEVVNAIFKTPGMYDDFVNVADRYFNKSQAIVREATAETQKSISVYDNAIKAGERMVAKIDKKIAALEEKLASATDEEERSHIMRDLSALHDQRDSKTRTMQSFEGGITEENIKGVAKRIDALTRNLEYEDILADAEIDTTDAAEEQLTNNAFNTVLNDDGTISESAVDVESTFEMIQKEDAETERTGKSSLSRQLDRKIDGISLKEDFKTIQEAVAEKIKQGPLGKLYRALLGSATSYGISEFIRAIGGEKLEKRFGLLAKHEAYDNAVIAKHDRLTGRIQTEVLGIKPKDAGSSVALQKLDNELSVKNVEVEMIDPRDATRTPRKVKLSQFELMDMYNIYKQTEAYVDEYGNVVGLSPRERLQKMFPTMKVEDILQNLDPRAKKYADIMAGEIGKELPTFVEAIKEMGMNPNFKPVKNYWPITTAVYQAEGEDYTNVTIARKGTEAEIGVFDAREKFNRYMSRVAATESQFYPALRRLRDLLYFKPNMVGTYHSPTEEARARRYQEESRNLQYLVQQRLGDKAFNQFVNLLDDFLKTRSENILSDSLAAKAGRNLTAALLMFKPIQAVKNFSNFFSHCGLAKDQGKYWNNTLRGIMNPKQTWETMMEYSTLCRKRLRGMSYSEYLNQQTTGGDSLVGTLFKNYSERNAKWTKKIAPGVANFLALNNVIKKLGMSPMLLGDAGSNVFGGYGLFMELVEKNNGDMEAAGKEFDETILRRQSSSNQATKSLLQRQWGRDFKGTFIAFTSEALNKTRDFVRSIEMVKEGEMTVKEAVMSNTSLLASVVAYSLISAGIWDLMSDDEEERDQVKQGLLDELLSQAGGTTIFGSAFVVPMIRMLFGEYSTGVSNAPLSEFAKFVKNVHNVAVGKDEDFANAFLQGLTIAGIGVGAPNALNSLRGVGRYATGSTEKERGAGLRQAFGRSKSYAEKREGIKPTKKTVEKDDEEE